jgi:hypothetical protein
LPCAARFPILGLVANLARRLLGVTDGVGASVGEVVGTSPLSLHFERAASRAAKGEPMGLGRLWKIPGAVAELTVGTMIVLYQLTVARAVEEKQRRSLDVTRTFPNPPEPSPRRSRGGAVERVATN